MQERLTHLAFDHPDTLIRMRARRILRIRYGITLPQARRDPVWLSAYNL